jgi:hypothetical protein
MNQRKVIKPMLAILLALTVIFGPATTSFASEKTSSPTNVEATGIITPQYEVIEQTFVSQRTKYEFDVPLYWDTTAVGDMDLVMYYDHIEVWEVRADTGSKVRLLSSENVVKSGEIQNAKVMIGFTLSSISGSVWNSSAYKVNYTVENIKVGGTTIKSYYMYP